MRPEVADLTYGEQLAAAMERLPISQRKLSFLLAAETGNTQESERRSIRKYLDGEVPTPKRAAILAVLLRAPELAVAPDAMTRRRGRLEELEERVATLETLLNEALPRLDQVAAQTSPRAKPVQPKPARGVR